MTKAPSKRKPGAARDLNAELAAAVADVQAGRWARKTEFTERADGSVRRRIMRSGGKVEKDEIIAADDWARAARAGTGLSQAAFARLIGVSVRTLQEWEQGRKRPSGPAHALLRIVAREPDVVYALNK